jgi:tRNA 2-thiouridine synthesizing protein A
MRRSGDAKLVDATGYRCPIPVILMEQALRGLAPGGRLTVIADDPLAAVDIPHYADLKGFAAERLVSAPGLCVFQVTALEKP